MFTQNVVERGRDFLLLLEAELVAKVKEGNEKSFFVPRQIKRTSVKSLNVRDNKLRFSLSFSESFPFKRGKQVEIKSLTFFLCSTTARRHSSRRSKHRGRSQSRAREVRFSILDLAGKKKRKRLGNAIWRRGRRFRERARETDLKKRKRARIDRLPLNRRTMTVSIIAREGVGKSPGGRRAWQLFYPEDVRSDARRVS